MQNCIYGARLTALSLAVSAAFPLMAQSQVTGALKEVVVTASRFEETANVLPYGVSVVTADEIHASGATSVNDAVMKILGVAGRLDLSGGSNYALDLRGFGATADSNQVVIVDGRRLNESDMSSANLAAIAIESVERIEVIRGAAGAVAYGEGATGGVIVITTKAGKGVQRHNAAAVSAALGSHNLRDVRASAVVTSGGLAIDVAGEERRSDGHRDNFSSLSNGLASTVQWSNDWLRLGAQSARNTLQSGLPGDLTAAQYDINPSQARSLTDKASVKGENTGLFMEAALGDWQLGLDAGQRTKKHTSESSWGSYDYDVNGSSANLRARHEQRGSTFANALVVGIDSNRWDRTILKSGFTPVGTVAKSDASAWYFTDDVTYLPGGTRLSVGLRSEELKKSESASASTLDDRQNAWHLGINQAIGSGLAAYARVGQSFRLANVDEFSFTTPGVALKAQTSRDEEVGARWGYRAGQVEVRWYRSQLRNEIGYDPQGVGPFGPFGANINFDPTVRQGMELETRHALSASVDLRVNAAARQARFTDGVYSGREVALVAGKTAAVGLDWHPQSGHLLSTGLSWVSSQYVDFDNACTVPSYSTVDARYAYIAGKVEFAVGVKNLADAKYYTQAFACTAGVTSGIYPEAGRTLAASLQVKF